ncbi:MAG: DUF1700 domain-containing protein [Bacilli bacterium]|nr:DUF1700 domain-containing protein [Bacilli bacterium]
MNKKDFLDFLNDKLYYLVDNVKSDEIKKYEAVIDNYTNMGQTEEDAISSFGEPDDLVKAIYLSHGLDYKKLSDGKLTGKSIKTSFKNFYTIISGSDKSKMKSAILSLLYIILLVVLLKIVFIFVRDLGNTVFGDMFSNKTFSRVYDLTFEILYVLVAILVFIKMFTKKFGK